jgi:hypothetical protein
MKRDVPAPVNGSTRLVSVKGYVDAETLDEVTTRGETSGLGISGYLRGLIMRDLAEGPAPTSREPIPLPLNRTEMVKTYVDVDLWAKARNRARRLGLSVSKYVHDLILRDQLDDEGRPQGAFTYAAAALPGLEAA